MAEVKLDCGDHDGIVAVVNHHTYSVQWLIRADKCHEV